MIIPINEFAKKINELHDKLGIQLRTPIKTAIEIGKLLSEVKVNIGHGNFGNWIKNSCNFDDNTAYRYLKCFLYNSKIPNVGNLQEAYKQIETIEKQEKQTDQQRKKQIINEYIETGIKPNNWDRALDYEYKKVKEEKESRTKRVEETKNKMQEARKKVDNDYKIFDEVNELFNDIKENENKKTEIKQQLKMSINDESRFIEVLEDYLNTLETDNLKLNACHNIIKFCKHKINEYQRESIK